MIGWKKLLSLLLAAALSLNLSPFALAAEDGGFSREMLVERYEGPRPGAPGAPGPAGGGV